MSAKPELLAGPLATARAPLARAQEALGALETPVTLGNEGDPRARG